MGRRIGLKKFGGLKTDVNPRLIGKLNASALRDARLDKGDLNWRSGWDRLYDGPVSNWAASYGIYFARGIDATGTVTDACISFEKVSTTTKAYERDLDDGTPTEITKPAASAQTLDNSEWDIVGWRNTVYGFNENDATVPLFSYTPGDFDSMAIIKRPTPPQTGDELAYTISYPDDPLTFTGIDNGDFSGTGAFSSAAGFGTNQFNVLHDGTTGATSWTLDWKADLTNQDYEYSDVFAFSVQYYNLPSTHDFNVDWSSFQFSLINDDGSPSTFVLEILDQVTGFDGSEISSKTYLLRFPPDSDRTLRDNIRKLKVEYTVTSSDASPGTNDVLTFLFWTEGGCDINSAVGAVDYLDITYAYYNSGSSTLSNLGPTTRIPFNNLKGFAAPGGFTNKFMGYRLSLTAIASSETGVDNYQMFASFVLTGNTSGQMRGHFGQFSDTTELTPTWGVSYDEYLLADAFEEGLTVNIETTGIVDMEVYKNWMILARRGGVNNIRHSWQNKPLVFAWPGQDDLDETRGIDQTLGLYGSDDPVKIIVCGDHIFIGGGRALYGIVGADHPYQLGNPIALPGSQGLAGRNAACAFTSDNGLTGCAFLGKDFNTIWFAYIDASFRNPTGGHFLGELSIDIRNYIFDNVFGGAIPDDTNEVQLYFDERGDCLILQWRGEKLLWRAATDGTRQWEHYTYNLDGDVWYRTFCHLDHGIRHIATGGAFDESEYDKSASFALFTGATPDNGLAMPTTGRYWQSADVGGEAMRPFRVWLEKENIDDEYIVDMIDYAGNIVESVFVGAGTEYAVFSPDTGARSRRYRVRSASGSGRIYQAEIEEIYAPRQLA